MAQAEELNKQANQNGIQYVIVAAGVPNLRPARRRDEPVEGVGFIESNRLRLGTMDDPNQRHAAGEGQRPTTAEESVLREVFGRRLGAL